MSYRLSDFKQGPAERRKGSRWLVYHWRQSWRRWMDRRLPPSSRIELSHRNVFISPTRAGAAYLLLCLILLLVAINFQNSGVYALTFLMGSVFIVSIFHTFRNLSGLAVSSAATEAVFAGNEALFTTIVTTGKSSKHFSLKLSWQDKESAYFDVDPAKEAIVSLRYQVGPRGVCQPGRIKLESRYPFGLLSTRTYVDVLHEVLVYPYPIDYANSHPKTMQSYETGPVERAGNEDFFGLRDYQHGDKVKNIAWKSYAKSGRLAVKQFVDYFDHRNCFHWDQLHGNTEERLSQIAYWAVDAENRGEKYGLEIPGASLEADGGRAHLARVLRCLALHEQSYIDNKRVELESSVVELAAMETSPIATASRASS